MLKTRAVTALFFVAVMLASVTFGAYTFGVFFILLSVWCLTEFYGMVSREERSPQRLAGVLGSLVTFGLYVAGLWGGVLFSWLWLGLAFVPLIFVLELFRNQAKPFDAIAHTFLGFMYVILPFFCFVSLAFIDGSYQYQYPLGFMLLLWTNDTGAYLTGRSFGKTKLFERISPNKTWEGLIGGVLLAMVAAVVINHYSTVLSLWQWLVMSALISTFGTLGDLVESMLKRSVQVKDSGNILPGHGGLLDRFDGLLISAPAVFLFFKLCC